LLADVERKNNRLVMDETIQFIIDNR
jgi:hypothetical protein